MKLNFQQKILAVAVASALVTPAFAVVDMNSTAPVSAKFAKEIDFSATALLSAGTTGLLDAKAKFGFNLGEEKSYTVLFKLDNAKFVATAAPELHFVPYTGGTASAAANPCITAGAASLVDGGKGVIYELSTKKVDTAAACNTADFLKSDTGSSSNYFQLTTPTISMDAQANVGLTYGLYVDPAQATAGGTTGRIGDGATVSTYIDTSGAVISFSAENSRKQVTDVTNGNKSFVKATATGAGAKYAELCALKHEFKPDPKAKDSAALGTAVVSTVVKDTTLVVTGDFSAASENGAYTDEAAKKRVFLHTNCSTDPITSDYAATLTQTTATFEIGNAPKNGVSVCYAVNGVTEIQPVEKYTVQYNPKAATGYSTPSVTVDCGSVEKGGTSDSISMALTADAAYPYFVRVTNPSSTDGLVHLKAYNDKGAEGPTIMSFTLKAGQSTGIIPIADIVTATGVAALTTSNDEAVDSTGAVIGAMANKLRITADAEFGAPGATAVKLTGITLSKDGNSFIILAD